MASEDSSPNKRRIYELPNELVERIIDYQKDRHLPSEVEAVRKLLDQALKSRDTVETLVGRFFANLGPGVEMGEVAGIVLSGHPLVRTINFESDHVGFVFRADDHHPSFVSIYPSGKIVLGFSGFHDSSAGTYAYDPARKPGKRLFDADEIPF